MDLMGAYIMTNFDINSDDEEPTNEPVQQEPSKQDLRQTKTFRKIEKDIKDKNRRKRKEEPNNGVRNLEIYVDKDRAISVGIGAEDLKGHIMKHRGQLLKTSRAGEIEAVGIHILLEQASHEMKHGDPNNALSYLERAISIRHDSVECLVLKGQCLVELSRYKEALLDADNVLKELKELENSKVYIVKGDALYNLGNFEHSLLNYHRGSRYASTKEKDEIARKVARTEIAVGNAVGEAASQYFNNLDRFLAKIPTNILGLPWFQLKNFVDEETKIVKRKQSKAKDKKFLSEMAQDKEYLENIILKLGAQSQSKTSYQKSAKKQAEQALDFLTERRDFWAQQRPDYPDPETVRQDSLTNSGHSWNSTVGRILTRKKFAAVAKL